MSFSRWLVIVGMASLPTGALGQVTDYSAGKSPAQLFATDCSACHQSARGLAKGRDQRSLSGFLREHYTTKQETAATLAAFLAGAPAGPPSETRNPGAPGGRQSPQQAGRQPRPPGAIIDPGADDGIIGPEPGTQPQRARPTREAAKPPANQRGKKPDAAAEEAEKETLRSKVRGYATVGDVARPKPSAPVAAPAAAAPPPPAASDTSARPPGGDAPPADKPSEPARSDAPATPAPSGEERRAPPG